MATNRILQDLIDLIEKPENGRSASPTSEFANTRRTGTSPHGGFNINRGHAVGGSLSSPVYGIIGSVDENNNPLGKIVIHEVDPVTNERTGFVIEILHTQAHFLKPGDRVSPGQEVGLEGGVGAATDKETKNPIPGPSHAHIQVFNGTDPTPLNPLRHLYEYHHPGQPIPDLPQFAPYSVPPRHGPRPKPANDPVFQGESPTQQPPPPQTTPPGANTPTRAPLIPQSPPGAAQPQPKFSPGLPIPGAEGPTSLGGPNGPTPLVLPQPASGQGKRSDIPGDMTPDATQATAQATPANWAFPGVGAVGLDDVLKYFNSAPPGTTVNLPFIDPNASASSPPRTADGDIVPERRLASRVINLSAPALSGAPPLSPDQPDALKNAGNWTAASVPPTPGTPDAQGTSQPLLGIFSGKPMPDWPVPPRIFATDDRARPSELFQCWMRWLDACDDVPSFIRQCRP